VKRIAMMFITAAAASAITLEAAGCGSSYSSQPYGSPVAATPSATPAGVGVANAPLGRLRARGVALSWSAAGGATGYEVWRSGKKLAAPAGRSFLDKTVRRGRIYAYRVRAVNGFGSGPFSTTIRFRA